MCRQSKQRSGSRNAAPTIEIAGTRLMDNFDRTLSVFADGEPVISSARTKLLGHEGLGLYPSLFMLTLSNLAEEDYLLLSRAREVDLRRLRRGDKPPFPL